MITCYIAVNHECKRLNFRRGRSRTSILLPIQANIRVWIRHIHIDIAIHIDEIRIVMENDNVSHVTLALSNHTNWFVCLGGAEAGTCALLIIDSH